MSVNKSSPEDKTKIVDKNTSGPSTSNVNNSINSEKFKIIIVGDSSVGKTSLMLRFCQLKELQQATVGFDIKFRTFKLDNKEIELQFWDTAGTEKFKNSILPQYYRGANAIIIVFDVTRQDTFNSIEQWIVDFDNYGLGDQVPKFLIGNKCDSKLKVDKYLAQMYAEQHNMPLLMTSTRLDIEHDRMEEFLLSVARKLKDQKSSEACDNSFKVKKPEPKDHKKSNACSCFK